MVPKEPVYADLQHSTNRPIPALPAELVPVQYATVKKVTLSLEQVNCKVLIIKCLLLTVFVWQLKQFSLCRILC